nr:MAG TPA: hypothetical protein [Bacteriophage sp.]DAQ58777.1 MAG TPA: hypothetical protein [Caudoviricetes sp.]DAV59290.1 MAG TPA: hypothetical protein [Caudoviricetes sp.]
MSCYLLHSWQNTKKKHAPRQDVPSHPIIFLG